MLKRSTLLSFTTLLFKVIVLYIFFLFEVLKKCFTRGKKFSFCSSQEHLECQFQDFHCDVQNTDTDYILENDELFFSLVWEAL